jgi:hypothetical protein
LGLAYGKSELLERWRPYKVRPASDEPLGHRFETGTLPTSCSRAFVAAVEYIDSSGGRRFRRMSANSGSSSSTACRIAARCTA